MTEQAPGVVASAFKVYRDAIQHWDAELRATGKVSPEVVAEVFECAEFVLRSYCLPENQGKDGNPVEPLPITLVSRIADQIRYITAGKCPAPIAALTGRGNPGVGPHEDHDIGIAVAYIQLAKDTKIGDSSPVKTISRLYGVDRSTVRKWQRRLAHIEPTVFWPYATPEARTHRISESMRLSAKRYRFAGRGAIGRYENCQVDG